MASVTANLSMPWSSSVLINSSNHTSVGSPGVTRSSETPCTMCCCGLLNHTLTVVFMVSLAFAIVVGNVVTLTVFMQTRQSRTPQGYLKGTRQRLCSTTKVQKSAVANCCFLTAILMLTQKGALKHK